MRRGSQNRSANDVHKCEVANCLFLLRSCSTKLISRHLIKIYNDVVLYNRQENVGLQQTELNSS